MNTKNVVLPLALVSVAHMCSGAGFMRLIHSPAAQQKTDASAATADTAKSMYTMRCEVYSNPRYVTSHFDLSKHPDAKRAMLRALESSHETHDLRPLENVYRHLFVPELARPVRPFKGRAGFGLGLGTLVMSVPWVVAGAVHKSLK